MDADNLNPFIGSNCTAGLIRSLNYDVLVGLDAATLTPTKGAKATGLATDWTTSTDGKTWTFTLRRDATWQDGHGPVTATDVAFTYNYIIDNDMTAFTVYTDGVKHAEAVNPYTVRIRCDQPKADMLNTVGWVPILPEHVWSKIPPERRREELREQTADRRQRLLPVRRVQEERLRQDGGQRGVLAWGSADRRGPVRVLYQPGQHGVGPRGRDNRRLL